MEAGVNRHGIVNPEEMFEEYLDPAVLLPVQLQRSWFIVQVKVQHLREDEYHNSHRINSNGKFLKVFFA